MPNINKIKLSGTSYDIQDSNATKTVTLTQAQYDALVNKDPNTFYIISDGETFDPSEKVDTSAFTAYSASVETALSGKQDTLIAGENITISGNVISAEGGSSITIDPSLDSGSTNPVANSAITTALNDTVKLSKLSTYYINGFTNVVNRFYPIFHRFDIDNQSNGNAWWFGKINDKYVITTGQTSVSPSGLMDLQVIETSAITTSVTSSSTDAQVPSAKAVYDAIQEGGGGGITSGEVQSMIDESISGKTDESAFTAHTGDTTIHVTSAEKASWNAKSDFSGDYNDLSNKLSGGTLINISNNKINCSAPIRYGTGNNSVIVGSSISTNKATGSNSIANGGDANTASGQYSYAEGNGTQATKHSSHSEGWFTVASGNYSHTEGNHTKTTNESEHSSGKYNVSSSASTTFGDSGNTLFSVGNGTSDSARHNAFEIRQNGDIYLTLDGQDVKLQDKLGGGSSYTAGDGIDITNDVISVTGKVDTSTYNTYTAATDTALASKQTTLTAGTGISIVDNVISAEGGSEINVVQTTGTSTADVMSQDAVTTQLNNKANKSAAVGNYSFGSTGEMPWIRFKSINNSNIGNEIYYPKINGKGILTNNSIFAQNNYNFQLVETSAITTSVTSSSTDAQVPSAKAVNDKLGGLSIVKLTQAQYDALSTKDSNTLYVIVN